LEELVQRMLAKAASHRLPTATSVLSALEEVSPRLEAAPQAAASPSAPRLHLTGAEQQLVTVLLAAPRLGVMHAQAAQDSRLAMRDSLRTVLAPQGARVELLADGALALTLGAALGSATDPATLAARCALSVLERWPEAVVVLTTGRGTLDSHLPVGEAMDRAGQLLRQAEQLPTDASTPVLLDEVTAGLLGPGFQLTPSHSGLFQLQGEHLGADASRPLLGKPTPCVGREQELALLDMAFSTCVEESSAQAILVTAPAGTGKSRLRHEFLRRLPQRHSPAPLVLEGRGDPMRAGSADGLVGQALRRLCGISGGEPLEERRARLTQRLSQHLPTAQALEGVEFLGELCAIPFPDEHSPRLRAARGDPQMMSVQVGRAWKAFLKAECARQPVVLVLEDLHWGDLVSVRLMDEALKELSEQPLLVLALARPEVEQLLPGAWEPRLQRVPLRGLSRKAGGRLVREVLGAEVSDALIDTLMEQAAGNALFLEELIRAVAEGRGARAPETVLAMLQARLGRLEPEARQVLLAASFFGRTFWRSGVRGVLGGEVTEEAVERRLRQLVEQEWVERQESSRFPGEEAYRFRHVLVRDAAYGLVPDSHKPEGHRRVGAWLEQAGESDPQVLAEHASLGQQAERAIHFLTRAAEQRFDRHDMTGTRRCVEAALALGAQGTQAVALHAFQAIVAFWQWDFAKLFELGPGVLDALKPGSRPWCMLASELYMGHSNMERMEEAAALGQMFVRTHPEDAARSVYLQTLCIMMFLSALCGQRQESAAYLTRLLALCAGATPETAPLEWTYGQLAQGLFSFYFEARPWQACARLEKGCRYLLEVGVERLAMGTDMAWAHAVEALGDRRGAEARFREHLALAQQVAPPPVGHYARLNLAVFLAHSAEPACWEEARALAHTPRGEGPPIFSGLAALVEAKVAVRRGALSEAEAEARKACGQLASMFFHHARAQRLLSQVLLAQGRAAEARQVAALGVQRLDESGSEGVGAGGLHLALAEACLADGDTQAGEAALRRALQCVRNRAGDIPDAAARARFLQQVPENARVLALARERWGAEAQ
jgi:hypothetical protein